MQSEKVARRADHYSTHCLARARTRPTSSRVCVRAARRPGIERLYASSRERRRDLSLSLIPFSTSPERPPASRMPRARYKLSYINLRAHHLAILRRAVDFRGLTNLPRRPSPRETRYPVSSRFARETLRRRRLNSMPPRPRAADLFIPPRATPRRRRFALSLSRAQSFTKILRD